MYIDFRLNKLRLSVISAVIAFAAAVCVIVPCVSADTRDSPPELYTLMYHGFTKNAQKQNNYFIDPACLENDLRYLRDNGYESVTVSDLEKYFSCGAALPDKPVMLTFDDGYYSNYLYAYPLLKKYGFRAMLSPIGRACEEAEKENKQDEFYSQCTTEQLGEMFSSGIFEAAYHSYDLHRTVDGAQGVQKRQGETDGEYAARLHDDIEKLRGLLKDSAGVQVSCFTYPFGAKSGETEGIIRAEGFTSAMDCEEKPTVLASPEDLYHIHRYLRPPDISSEEFFAFTEQRGK